MIESFAQQPVPGMIVLPGGQTVVNREIIADLAARHRVPAIYPYKYFAASGGLASYGSDDLDLFRRAAQYVDRILKGARPGDLPIQAPTKFEFVINLKAAKAIAHGSELRREFIAGLGAVGWPLAARGQKTGVSVIGFLDMAGPLESREMEAFRKGLADGGFVDGVNLFIEYRWASGNFGRLPDLAADLVGRQIAVIVAVGGAAPIALARRIAPTTPIVFFYGGDAVKDGLVVSLNRPGRNVTGIMGITDGERGGLEGKRLEFLLQLVPQARKIGLLSNDTAYGYEQFTTSMLVAGRALGVEIMVVECHDDHDYEAAVAKMVEGGAGGMILSGFVLPNLGKVVRLAALYKLPAIYPDQWFVRARCGLMSYDPDSLDLFRRLGSAYVARILKGAKPADLPVEQPQKFRLTINLKTAQALGLTIPPNLLALAEVIE